MRRLVWSVTAQRDLRAIVVYQVQFSPELPRRLVEQIERAATKLLDFPQLGPALPDAKVRVWRAKGTPFLLFYRPARDNVRILKVRDARTDWKPRE